MIRTSLRALAVAFLTLNAAAMIVDSRRAEGLPDGYPLLAELRAARERLVLLGLALAGPPSSGADRPHLREISPRAREETFGTPDSGSWNGTPDHAAATTPVSQGLPSGSGDVRVNRGLR